jgi:CBS domain containing-hemolysin-like protein
MTDEDEEVLGIITMQDVMEELVQIMLRSYSSFD